LKKLKSKSKQWERKEEFNVIRKYKSKGH